MKNKLEILNDILIMDAMQIVSCLDFEVLANKKVMITGTGGLIGINFLASLLQIRTKIPGITIFPVIHSEPSDFLLPFLNSNEVYVFRGDLTDEAFIETLPNADIIIHAAGSGEPGKFTVNTIETLKINTLTTLKLFKKLNVNGRFLFISSSDIYNGLKSSEYSEDQVGTTNTDHPRACYIEGKRTGETICHLYRKQGIKAFSVRLSSTYGPGTKIGDQRVLPSFIQKAMKGKIELLDSGEAMRTFCYISDAIEMMWHVILYGNHGCYNVGGVSAIKIKELANMIGKTFNAPVVTPQEQTSMAGAPDNVSLNLDRIMSEYHKVNFIDLKEGLMRSIDWYKNLYNVY